MLAGFEGGGSNLQELAKARAQILHQKLQGAYSPVSLTGAM